MSQRLAFGLKDPKGRFGPTEWAPRNLVPGGVLQVVVDVGFPQRHFRGDAGIFFGDIRNERHARIRGTVGRAAAAHPETNCELVAGHLVLQANLFGLGQDFRASLRLLDREQPKRVSQHGRHPGPLAPQPVQEQREDQQAEERF